MESKRQMVSDILSSTKSLSLDDRLSKRWLLSIAMDKASTLIRQDSNEGKLFEVTDIWQSLDCIEMEKVNATVCGDIPNCRFLMKSKRRLPETFESAFGDIIKILTIEGGKEYGQTKPFTYKDIVSREYKDANQRYFWILDRYLYIPDSEVKFVTGIGLFKRQKDVDLFNDKEVECASPLDDSFPCPQYLLGVVKDQVKEEVAKLYKSLVKDERPDDNQNQK